MKEKLYAKNCERCERELPLGSTKYRLYLEITSDWDGYLPDPDGQADAAELIEKAAKLDQETLEQQIHLETSMLICPQCRREILTNLAGKKGNPLPAKHKSSVRLQ
ncbi:MAG: hypothetical protein GX444_06740 [Myxococcales bacterium]|nr:hypothetical protein [Myxococcales bacterium]